ncbi:hypothetical protein [Magnetospira thiophila]
MTATPEACCAQCRHFVGEPQALEKLIGGLAILSSAHGSVRADTGWCADQDRFRVARDGCPRFQQNPGEA